MFKKTLPDSGPVWSFRDARGNDVEIRDGGRLDRATLIVGDVELERSQIGPLADLLTRYREHGDIRYAAPETRPLALPDVAEQIRTWAAARLGARPGPGRVFRLINALWAFGSIDVAIRWKRDLTAHEIAVASDRRWDRRNNRTAEERRAIHVGGSSPKGSSSVHVFLVPPPRDETDENRKKT